MHYFELALLIATVISLLVDMTQTLKIKDHPELHEINLILGQHPTDNAVKVYFWLWIVGLITGFAYVPAEYMDIVMGFILGIEVRTIRSNMKLNLGW